MNDYTTQGSFYCPLNATAVTVDNTPSTQAFHLEVYKTTGDSSNGVCQVAYSFHQDNVRSWWRNGYGGSWSEWYEVANKEDIASLNNNKANIVHTHGVAKQTSTIASNTFLTQLGNLAIFSWWTGNINISSANTWTDIWTLPVTNKGKCVWSVNIYNGVDLCYFRINENSNKVQALSNKTGSIPLQPGELIFFID